MNIGDRMSTILSQLKPLKIGDLTAKLPIIQGGMAWVAEHHLAAAVSAAGGLGLIGGANAPGEVVREEIRKARELTDKPIGVNVMLLSPHADDVARVVVEEGIKVVTTGAGNPEKYMDMWKAAGIKVIPVVASVALAKRMEKYGADAVVAEGMESGGHIGEQTTMTLVPQVVDEVSIPVIAAGGIGTGVWYHFKGNGQSGTGDSIVYVSKVSVITGSETTAVNRFAGVVEPQKTVNVKIESGRKVKEVEVKTGEEVKAGQLLFEYDLSSIEDDLKQAQLDLDRLKNEQISLTEQIATLEAEKKKAKAEDQLSYTIEIETNKMNLKKNEYSQKSKQSEIDKLQSATQNTEVRSEIDGVIQKIDTSKMTSDDGDSVDDSSAMDSSMSSGDGSSDSSAFITILSTGAYRVKGKVNEQNRDSIVPGEAVIIRSRVDLSLIHI